MKVGCTGTEIFAADTTCHKHRVARPYVPQELSQSLRPVCEEVMQRRNRFVDGSGQMFRDP